MGAITGTVVIALLAAASAASLSEVVSRCVDAFNDISTLSAELGFVVDASRELVTRHLQDLDKDSAEAKGLAQYLQAQHLPNDMNQYLYDALQAMELLQRRQVEDPILVVLARRFFLASVTLRWLASGQKALDSQAAEHLKHLVAQLYAFHGAAVSRKGLLEYFHISKSGGTSFSIAARLSNCDMAPNIGQPEELGDLPHWINGSAFKEATGGANVVAWSLYGQTERGSAAQGCRQRAALVRHRGYRYFSNEYTLQGGRGSVHKVHVCPQVVNVVALRHPEERLLAHMHYMLARFKKRVQGFARAGKGDDEGSDGAAGGEARPSGGSPSAWLEKFYSLFCSGDAALWDAIAPAVTDNYITRSFLGESGFHSPVGSIGEEALGVARRLLLQFDLVLDLGAGDEAADLIMRQGLGWNVTLAEVHLRSTDQSVNKLNYSKAECRNEQLLRMVMPRQEPDRRLYSTGRAISFLDLLLVSLAHAVGLEPRPPTEPGPKATGGMTAPPPPPPAPQFCGLLNSTGLVNGTARAAARAGLLNPATAGNGTEGITSDRLGPGGASKQDRGPQMIWVRQEGGGGTVGGRRLRSVVRRRLAGHAGSG